MAGFRFQAIGALEKIISSLFLWVEKTLLLHPSIPLCKYSYIPSRSIQTTIQTPIYPAFLQLRHHPSILFRHHSFINSSKYSLSSHSAIHTSIYLSSHTSNQITHPSNHRSIFCLSVLQSTDQSTHHLSVYPSIILSIHPFVFCPSIHPSIHLLSVHPSIHPSIHPSNRLLSVHPSIYLSSVRPSIINLFISSSSFRPSIHPSIQVLSGHPSIYPSVRPPFFLCALWMALVLNVPGSGVKRWLIEQWLPRGIENTF